jgi:hypothetical protein
VKTLIGASSRWIPHSLNFHHRTGEPLQVAFHREFDPAIERAEMIAVAGIEIPVVVPSDLITMKQRAADVVIRQARAAARASAFRPPSSPGKRS